MFLNLFNAKRFLNVYFLGLITGGLVFLLSYTIFPVFSGNGASLIGASAGVTAVFIFICSYMPYQEVRVFFFNVKLWQLGVFFILTDLIQIPNGNAGGHLAHIGGGILGFVYANKLKEGKDIGRSFETIFSQLFKVFTRSKTPLKTAYKRSKSTPSQGVTTAYKEREQQKKTDAILDKISHSGYDSLTKEEKDYLLYCLILSAAKVQSSTGHQNGYLKTFSPNSLKPLELKIQNINHEYNNTGNKTCIGDVFDFISAPHDIFYFDPPYGTCNYHVPVATRYTAFYHFWNTLILNDSPEVFGKANRRIDSKGVTDKFEVNKKETFLPLLKRLFEESNGKDVFVSLSNQSVVNKEDVLDYMNLPIRVYEIAHAENVQGKKVRKDGEFSVKKKPLVEYLYHLEK